MKDLIVGSVFSCDDARNINWFNIQQSFLEDCSVDHTHDMVIALQKYITGYFDKKVKHVIKDYTNEDLGVAHLHGLNQLINYFKQIKNEYRYFLIIDSDAFPIRHGWYSFLVHKMHYWNRKLVAPIRYEHLDRRFHVSVIFGNMRQVDELRFVFNYTDYNLNYENLEFDILIEPYQTEKSDQVYVLLKSNMFDFHPAFFTVYYDCFYHHGCGSRLCSPIVPEQYWSHLYFSQQMQQKYQEITEFMFKYPYSFIDILRHGLCQDSPNYLEFMKLLKQIGYGNKTHLYLKKSKIPN